MARPEHEGDILDIDADEADRQLIEMANPQPEAPEPPPEPAPEPEQANEPEPQPEAEPEPQQEESVEEPPVEQTDEFDFQASYAKEMELMRAQIEQAQKRRDQIAGQYGSELQTLRQQNAALQAQMQQMAQPQPQQDPYAEVPAQQPTPMQQQVPAYPTPQLQSEETQALRQQIVNNTYGSFTQDVIKDIAQDYSDDSARQEATQDLVTFVQSRVKETVADYQQEFGDVPTSRLDKFTRQVLDSAYTDWKLGRIRAAREAALQRKAEQVPRHRQVQAAAPSGGNATGVTPQTEREPQTAEEADQWLIQQFGDGHSRSRRRG